MLTQRTALFLLSPSPVPSFLSLLHLFYASHLLYASPSPIPPIDTLILLSPPSRGDILGHDIANPSTLVIVDITLAREQTIRDICIIPQDMELEKNIAVHASVKKEIFFFLPDGYAAPIFELYPRYVRAIVDARPPPLLSTTTTIEIILRYP